MAELITIIALLLFMVVREVLHFKQVVKLEELLKSNDVTEYYKARGIEKQMTKAAVAQNAIMEEPNDMRSLESDFEIGKITNINVDGEDHPIQIY